MRSFLSCMIGLLIGQSLQIAFVNGGMAWSVFALSCFITVGWLLHLRELHRDSQKELTRIIDKIENENRR